jgi:hypothetical protein
VEGGMRAGAAGRYGADRIRTHWRPSMGAAGGT